MVTSLNSGIPGRDANYQMTHFIRKTLNMTEMTIGTPVVIGKLPANAIIVGGGVQITTAFNGTTPAFNVGYSTDSVGSGDVDAYATLLTASTIGLIALDELAAGTNAPRNVEVTLTATVSGTTVTTGVAEVIVQFIPKNPSSG